VRIEKEFDVARPRAEAAALLAADEVLCELFPDTRTEIVGRKGRRKTVASHYTALGREGTATFHFDYAPDGGVQFEKVCDGRVWKELRGAVTLTERKDKTRVRIELEGRTKALVPEFTIRGPMQDQLEQMAKALRRRLSAS
jgi:carbon monoxide dehydrogenase subunit G